MGKQIEKQTKKNNFRANASYLWSPKIKMAQNIQSVAVINEMTNKQTDKQTNKQNITKKT